MTLTPLQALLIDEAYARDLYRPTDTQVDRLFADARAGREIPASEHQAMDDINRVETDA